MKTVGRLLLLGLVILANGCVSNQGQPTYPAGGMFGQTGMTQTEPIAVADTNRSAAAAVSPEELLSRKVEPQFPARVAVARLNPFDPQLATILQDGLTRAVRAEPRLADVDWLFTENFPWPSGTARVNLAGIQDCAARFQARYVLLAQYQFNPAERTYWLPACITICTLGLVPMPVGGQQSYCTAEFVLMDVASGVFILNAQGQGHAQRTAVWGWVANMGGSTPLERQSLRLAVDQATPRLRDALLQFHR
jgi:hypothetical protein